MPYHPMPEHPWPPHDGWIVAWWNDEHDCWTAGAVRSNKQEALDWLHARRAANPGEVWRLVRDTTTYTAEDD